MSKTTETINNFEKILLMHIEKNITEFYFNSEKNLTIKHNGEVVENKKMFISKDFLHIVLKKLISNNQNRLFDSIEDKDLLEVSGGVLEYDLQEEKEGELKSKVFKCKIEFKSLKNLSIQVNLEPDIEIGYGQTLYPNKMKGDEKLEYWFDSFTTNVIAMKDPKPKDLILHPNKSHPFLTVTGGLRPITDLKMTKGLTNRIAKLLVKLSHNPYIEDMLEKNGDKFDNLDLDLAYKTKSGKRFRVNIADIFDTEVEHGALITMRLLPDKPFTVTDLNLPQVLMDTIFNLKMGLIIVSGTTGSGKSTTMSALIDYLLKIKSLNLLTIENPIETIFPANQYPKSVITQREIGKHSITQSNAMQSAVRQTLNVAMVGEIRNDHDAMMALELAQSGHLIFATLHSGTVGESIERIVEMFPAEQSKKMRDLLAAQYKMGIAQTLVKGVHGQTELALEIFKTNSDIKAYITQTQDEDNQFSMREIIEMYAEATDTMSYDQCLVKLFNSGKINEDIMMFNSPDPDSLIFRQSKLGLKLSAKWDPIGSQLDDAMKDMFNSPEEEQKPDESDIDDFMGQIENIGNKYNGKQVKVKSDKFQSIINNP